MYSQLLSLAIPAIAHWPMNKISMFAEIEDIYAGEHELPVTNVYLPIAETEYQIFQSKE